MAFTNPLEYGNRSCYAATTTSTTTATFAIGPPRSKSSPSRSSIGHPDSIWNKDHEAVRFEPGSNQLWLDASLGQQTPEAALSFSFLQLATTAFARPDPGIEALHNGAAIPVFGLVVS